MTSFAATLYRELRSPTLAVVLLLALAVLAAAGTFLAPPDTGEPPAAGDSPLRLSRIVGLRNTFQSPLFLSLVAGVAVNVVACTWHRLSPRLRRRGGRQRALTDLALHGSLLLILAGALAKGLFSFVGTQIVNVGEGTETVYDWRARRDAPLGFGIRAEEMREGFYPLQAHVGVALAATAEKLEVLDLVEGEQTQGRRSAVRLRIAGYDSAAGVFRFGVLAGGAEREITLATRPGSAATARVGDYDLTLVAFKAILREINVRISLIESGAAVASGWLTTNSRLRHRDLSLFLTAWGADEAGRRYCGIQVARDPGAPFFWAGCVLIALAIPWHLWAKGRSAP